MADLAEGMDATDGQKRCTYCFQELNEMTDPRELPCTHIVCLPCLKNDWKLEEPQCRVCSTSFGAIDALPKTTIIHQEQTRTSQAESIHRCDIGNDHSTATKFCVDCGKRMCKAHTESHQHFFEAAHKTIDISTYSVRPDYYSQAYCEDHPNNPIRRVCGKCYYIPCSFCSPGVCQASGTHHYQPLENIRAPVQAEFDHLMKKCSEKIAELCNLEKQTWRTVDDLNEKCEALISQVEETRKQQVAEIMKKSDDLKQQIADYQAECLAKIDSYTVKLIEEVAEIEREQLQTQQFLRENHTAKIIRERAARLDKLKHISICGKLPYDLDARSQRILIPTGTYREIELKLSPTAMLFRSLDHVRDFRLPIGTYCRTISLVQENKLMVGSTWHVAIYDLATQNILRSYMYADGNSNIIRSVDTLNQLSASAVICFEKTGVIYSVPPDLSSRSILFHDESSALKGKGRLCVSGKYVVACNKIGCEVIVFDTNTKLKCSFKLAEHEGGQIRSICAARDEKVLTLDWVKGIVCCYKLHENTTPTLRWRCSGITGGYAICSDDRGLVYVSAEGKLYILMQGTLLTTLECSDLPTHKDTSEFSDISVYGNCLVTTQHESLTVRLFSQKVYEYCCDYYLHEIDKTNRSGIVHIPTRDLILVTREV